MKLKTSFTRLKIKWLMAFMVLSACVERIDFDVPPAEFQTVVEGVITDSPGPYTVNLSQALKINADSSYRTPIQNAKIKLYDDEGNTEDFTEASPGVYITGGLMQGAVGHAYHIRIETVDGKIFESEPDKINPVGNVEDIRYEFEARTRQEPFGEVRADVFNIYVDANAGTEEENYIRWRMTGTYQVITHPELHYTDTPPYTPYKNPFPCSGYVLLSGPAGSGGTLERREDCTCCTCWVKQYESVPQLSDMQLVSGSEFKNVKVGEVPITNATFYEKYMVEVEQMSLSRNAFEFFKLIRQQKERASSLFQPPSGEIKGNIKAANSNDAVIGLFYATTIRKRTEFISAGNIPYPVTPIDYITLPCYDFYPNASATKPTNWE